MSIEQERFTPREETMIAELKRIKLSPSHNLDHGRRVARIALRFQKMHGGSRDVLVAASFLHDLARNDPTLHGREQRKTSAKKAVPVLERCGYKKEEIEKITQAIIEHDQPQIHSELLEARILKDADFLDGFGARGILRTILYTGETGGDIEEVIERLEKKMPARIKGLEFSESKRVARREWSFVQLFLSLLEKTPEIEKEKLPGKYLVFEGTSGSGKETQARLLKEKLQKMGQEVILVFEPSDRLKRTLKEWRKEIDDPIVEMFLFLADRWEIINSQILPTLMAGKTVVSLRSFISTLVYQRTEKYKDIVGFLHRFVPEPDVIIFLDVPSEIAFERIKERLKKTGEPLSKFEELERLKRYREVYKKTLDDFPQTIRIDGSREIEGVQQEIWEKLKGE